MANSAPSSPDVIFESLNEFDRHVAEQIGEVFPEWISHATAETDQYGETALVVTIPAPSGRFARPLRIETFGGEVTVSFDCYHGHFSQFSGGLERTALDLIQELLSEENVVVSYWRDNQGCGAFMAPSDDIPNTNDEYPYANRLRIRSWSGRFDRDISCEPRG
jgi:hypothetical protein